MDQFADRLARLAELSPDEIQALEDELTAAFDAADSSGDVDLMQALADALDTVRAAKTATPPAGAPPAAAPPAAAPVAAAADVLEEVIEDPLVAEVLDEQPPAERQQVPPRVASQSSQPERCRVRRRGLASGPRRRTSRRRRTPQ